MLVKEIAIYCYSERKISCAGLTDRGYNTNTVWVIEELYKGNFDFETQILSKLLLYSDNTLFHTPNYDVQKLVIKAGIGKCH